MNLLLYPSFTVLFMFSKYRCHDSRLMKGIHLIFFTHRYTSCINQKLRSIFFVWSEFRKNSLLYEKETAGEMEACISKTILFFSMDYIHRQAWHLSLAIVFASESSNPVTLTSLLLENLSVRLNFVYCVHCS